VITGVRRSAAAVAVALLAAVSASASASAETGLVSIGAGLRGPSGVRATVYATGLRNVSAIAVDSRGRLWATTSAASDHSHDGLYLVAHRGAKPVLVAHVAEPLGLVWDGSTLFVAARGKVLAFTHLSGHRFGKRTVILDGPDPKAANDTILVLPNGRLMMSVSATCDHCRQMSRYSAAIVTFDLDGSHLRVYASGIRDGYGLALIPGTTTLLVSMNQRDDLGGRTPGDWLAVVRQGQSWGFPRCWDQGGTVCRRVPAPLAVLDRHAGAGAVAVFGTFAIVPEWATGKVERVALTGSTHVANVFLTGLKNPLAATVTNNRLLIGDWTTGRIYAVTER
jgi:glucose/arabinose dehydrogenase